ncbi:DNA sulfur modification protein DndD [Umezakia ovalisporum]|jgi:DNA sulfur modification protein DndD|uniref:Nuclease SbcCD subunit C n=2 Tax=Umezakia ovalisporum TaxID=75695 RepID=A0AA43KDD3_9CYAN|nr:DNA sulfur modification protein DndD [Umezakia ovalisporum]MBI1240665.1 DNA sulfur modification protein DndD [Nostoc sp. RI_552]MDH6055362.1 DNA sulfur modification protein DndD [Umezakia ovalisporum FSS-43]MDH6062414.1 DNA sulfur modification protein DndD [Umezakia ovalisporum FSS-62]MDH6066784.1 DNA sulfur modification protein DndD [Umezakia ovalisporum APH033B]MDH6072144.1 DNA sulfur modification protein DndD [Umezakia ovalisporum CobakiLakeA]
MIFLELVLQNFGPYCGRQVINLDPTIDEENSYPIILLGGMNGGGKTTLMDAIRLALYGHRAQCSTRGNLSYNDFLAQCVNTHSSPTEDTRIELVFEHLESDQPVKYRVVRRWTKNPKDGRDQLGVLDAQEWLDTALANIWDEYIENLLPLGISNLFLFDGEQVKELAEQETPPPIVVEAIRGLLGLELAERLGSDLEIIVNRKRKEVADTQDLVNLEEIEQELNIKQDKYQKIENQLKELSDTLLNAQKKQQKALNKFISEGGKIAGDRSQLERQRNEITAEAEKTRLAMSELAADMLPLGLITPLLNEVYIQGEKEFRTQQAKIGYSLLLEREQRLIDLINKLNLEETQVDKIKEFMEEENQVLHQDITGQSWLLADTATLHQLDNVIHHYLLYTKKAAQEKLTLLQTKEEEIITIERQIQTAASPEDYQKLVDELQQAQTEVAEAQAACEIAKRDLNALENQIRITKKNLEKYTETNIDRKHNEHIINAAAKVQETLKLFREKLTLRKLNKLEIEVTECFRYLLHKSDLVHRVAIDTENFGLSLYDFNGQPVPKHRLSAGEKQLLAIAFLWGLARVSGRRLPVAIDTPLGRLDSSHRGNLVERYFPSASHQVILLSTDTEIAKKEVETLRKNQAIAREYLLKYDSSARQTTVIENQYFW